MSKTIYDKFVPCNGCFECCKHDLIILKPFYGDNVDDYEHKIFTGKDYILEHKKNGDCIYLDRSKGCTIHENRPYVCRNLDCRFLLALPKKRLKALIKQKIISKHMLEAAKRIKDK